MAPQTTILTTGSADRDAGRGLAQRWTRTIIPTLKEPPAEAEAPSHRLLLRAGCIRRVGAGIYNYLPLAWRTLQKISQIVREEMNAAGASEMLMPALEPIELMRQTGRDADYGDNLFRVTDRHNRVEALAPTHEEIITDMMKGAVNSYKQLPLNLYQIQTKFRDEFRPRSGLLRCREFIMKDAYSFHLSVEGPGGLDEGYEAMRRAYVNIFTRCGLDFTMVEAESGPIGGSASHEFMVNCDSGEDVILRCPASGYAANVEKCEIGERPWSFDGEPTGDLEKVHTPEMPTIEQVGRFMSVKPRNMLKTVVFRVRQDEPGSEPGAPATGSAVGGTGVPPVRWVLAVVRGDHEVNEGKVGDATGLKLGLADEKEAREAGFAVGYVSPRAAAERDDVMLVVDPDAAQGSVNTQGNAHGRDARATDPRATDAPAKPMFWATGADEKDHHIKHFNWRRDIGGLLDDPQRVKVADIRNARAGDPSPRAQGVTLEEGRGIEVGHIFKLGDKYSRAMGFSVLDEQQQRRPVIMGCYGIGVSRTMQACVEMSHDESGIVWPAAIAPFHVHIVPMKVDPNDRIMQAAERLAEELTAAGLDVLIDDRDERPGVKFKDADLIGMPVRLTIGDKALDQGCVEFKRRDEAGKGTLIPINAAARRCVDVVH